MDPKTWRQFFQDKGKAKEGGTGELSATRLVLFLWATGVLVVWGIDSIKSVALQDIPQSVVTILGLALGAKAVQRFGEH
jgi:predicted membrane protein